MTKTVILLSGKRYAGKDYTADRLKKELGDKVHTQSIAYFPKLQYAKNNNLNIDKLLCDRTYKEKHRAGIIQTSNKARKINDNIWISQTLEYCRTIPHSIIVITDFRFLNEDRFFRDNCDWDIITVRINASNELRESRGWRHNETIDNGQSETELDTYQNWNYIMDFETECEYETLFMNFVISLQK